MADLNRDALQRLAQLGARARLQELRQEEVAIRQAFPDLFRGRRGGRKRSRRMKKAAAGHGRRRRRSMSPAARRAVSARMKKYWADRRKRKASK